MAVEVSGEIKGGMVSGGVGGVFLAESVISAGNHGTIFPVHPILAI